MADHTPGPWMVATSNSWRRIVSRDHGSVCEPIVHHSDHHPDLIFRNGGEDGPDARLLAAAPELLEALKGLTGLYSSVWDRTDGAAVIFDVERMEAAFAAATKAITNATEGHPVRSSK